MLPSIALRAGSTADVLQDQAAGQAAGRRPDAGGAACQSRLPTPTGSGSCWAQAATGSRTKNFRLPLAIEKREFPRMARLPAAVRPDFDAAGTAALSRPSSKPTELSARKDEFRTNWRALFYRAESAHLLGLGRLCCSSAAGRGYAFCSGFNDFNPAGGRAIASDGC